MLGVSWFVKSLPAAIARSVSHILEDRRRYKGMGRDRQSVAVVVMMMMLWEGRSEGTTTTTTMMMMMAIVVIMLLQQ